MRSRITATALGLLALALALPSAAGAQAGDLWKVYDRALSKAKYIDLTNTLYPGGPVWSGFGPAQFKPTVNPTTGLPYTYAADGFEATSYLLSTDQFGTQFDPPAHWAALSAAMTAHMPEGVAWTEPAGGFLTWVTLPDGLDTTALRPDAIAAGVAYVPGAPFFVDGGGARTLRLSFSHLAGPGLATAAERLGGVVRAALDRVVQPTSGR